MLMKLEVVVEVEEGTTEAEVEKHMASACAHYFRYIGHAGNASATVKSTHPGEMLTGKE